MPISDPDDASHHFRALAPFVTQLQVRDLAVFSHSYDYLSFGSWSIIAGTRHRRVRVTWDGKEGALRVAVSDFVGSGAPAHWKRLDSLTLPIGSDNVTLLNAAADLIISHHQHHPHEDEQGGA